MAVFQDNIPTSGSTSHAAVDLCLGVFSLALTLLSFLFNGIVFIYNYRQDTVTARLYVLLSVLDFLTLLFYPPAMAVHFFSDSPDRIVPVYLLLVFLAVLVLASGMSALLVSFMCVYRLLGIKYPLQRISKRTILVVISCFGLYALLEATCSVIISNPLHPLWYHQRQTFDYTGWKCSEEARRLPEVTERFKTLHQFYLIPKLTYMATVVVNTVTSLSAVYVLMTTKPANHQNSRNMRRSAVTLFILNVGSVLSGIYILTVSLVLQEGNDLDCVELGIVERVLVILSFPFSPLCMALFNPIIIFFRSTEMKHFVKRGIHNNFARIVCNANTNARVTGALAQPLPPV